MSNYNIKMAAKLSGVSELSIRSWENRYSAVIPKRTDSNRRLYSDDNIEKLILLKKLTQHGNNIGSLASLSVDKLFDMLSKIEMSNILENANESETHSNFDFQIINECLDVIKNYDDKQLLSILNEMSLKYSRPNLIEKVLLPLIIEVGKLWESGGLRVSHEHFTSAVLIKFINNLNFGFNIQDDAPRIIVATPEGQYHEVGALIGAMLASSDGWRTTYMGTCLPVEDLAAAALQLNVRCIFLSIVYPNDNPSLNNQLNKLRQMLGDDVFIIIAGNASGGYQNSLNMTNVLMSNSSSHFRKLLKYVREQINPNMEK
ncbi:MAG: MerR family transcriptional regulator [bacterium]